MLSSSYVFLQKPLVTVVPEPPRMNPPSLPNRAERAKIYGIDCAENIHFTSWETGGEYKKDIVVKNVFVKTQKIKYKLPKTKFFSLDFPVVKTLSTGMSWTIPVTFRPVAKEPYYDVIEFITSTGNFYFSILATLDRYELVFQESIEFGFCPIKEIETKVVTLTNHADLATEFSWSALAPFKITPAKGVLKGLETIKLSIDFHPMEACPFQATAICEFGSPSKTVSEQHVIKVMEIHGVGKFSHLIMQSDSIVSKSDIGLTQIEFGQTLITKSTTRKFELINPSQVKCKFRIVEKEDREKYNDSCFVFSCSKGTIPANGKLEIEVTFTPTTPEYCYMEYFSISTVSGNKIDLVLTGQGIGPIVQISTNIIHFEDLEAGSISSRAITLTNASEIEAFYEFQLGNETVFFIDKAYGKIHPKSSVGVAVKFRPVEPIHYYKRVYLLIENQNPSLLELIGTCYTEKRRPASFLTSHLKKFEERTLCGLSFFPPEQLDEMIKIGTLSYDSIAGTLIPNNPRAYEQYIPNSIPSSIQEKYFSEQTMNFHSEIHIENPFIDFGSSPSYQIKEPLTLKVVNRTRGKMTCHWVLNYHSNPVFSIYPTTMDIPPKSTGEFRVDFRPDQDDRYYGCFIDGYAYYKSMRNFRLINEESFTPPWCLTAYVAGNTFFKSDSFIPKITFENDRIVFPSCLVGDQIYRTIKVTNTGDTPVRFWFTNDPSNVFSVKPSAGLLNKSQSQLIMFRFSPTSEKTHIFPIKCHFNTQASNFQEINLIGISFMPKLTIEPSLLCMKPTSITGSSSSAIKLLNNTNIPLKFKWQIPNSAASFIGVKPAAGSLLPNEVIPVTIKFQPRQVKTYNAKINCLFFNPSRESDTGRQGLTIMGQAIKGSIKCVDHELDFSSVLINQVHGLNFELQNTGDCDMRFYLYTASDEALYWFEPSVICLSARSKMSATVFARLTEQRQYVSNVFYCPVSSDRLGNDGIMKRSSSSILSLIDLDEDDRISLVTVKAKGVYPSICIRDIKGDGYSKPYLWSLFSVDKFNDSKNSQDIEFNFSGDIIGSSPTVIYVELLNSGIVDVNWSFAFPNDIELELFAKSKNKDDFQVDDESKETNQSEEFQLFSISPRSGVLKSGETTILTFTYNHKISGSHVLPVMFRVKNGGGERSLTLIAESHVSSKTFIFPMYDSRWCMTGVPVGTSDPPIQTYFFQNKNNFDIEYKVDVEELNDYNGDFKILTCLNPEGKIRANETGMIEWKFQPIQVKTYNYEVPISIEGYERVYLNILGSGIPNTVDLEVYDQDLVTSISTINFKMATLSIERLDFGTVGVLTNNYAILIIRNITENTKIEFDWVANSYVTILPRRGVIEANGFTICKLKFTTTGEPRIYNQDLRCQVSTFSDMEKHRAQIQEFNHLKMEAQNSIAANRFNQETSIARKLRKFLPPIKPGEKSNIEIDDVVIPRPKTDILFCSIKARAVSMAEFQERYPNRCKYIEQAVNSERLEELAIEESLKSISNVSSLNSIAPLLFEMLDSIMLQLENEDILKKLADSPPNLFDETEDSYDQRKLNDFYIEYVDQVIVNLLQEAANENYELWSLASLKVVPRTNLKE